MEVNRRRVFIMAAIMVWCVACTILYARWGTMVTFFSVDARAAVALAPAPASPSSLKLEQHQKLPTESAASRSQQRQSPTRASRTSQHGNSAGQTPDFQTLARDDLGLRVDDFSSSSSVYDARTSAGEGEKWMMRGGKGVVRRINASGLGRKGGWELLNKLVQEGKLDFRAVARYPLEDEYLTPMDREILADEPVKDLTTVASPATSQLEVVGLKKGTMLRVGEKVSVRVVLKDTKGRPVLKGGHHVRVRVISQGTGPRSANVDVTDLRNGTYVASVPVLWPGRIAVQAALQRPREFRRVMLTLMNTMKMMNEILGSFVSGSTEEVTLCSVIPLIPGYPEVCNLTSLNSGLPWYCGRPSTPGLLCRHWTLSSHTAFPQRYPVSEPENRLVFQWFARSETDCTKKEKLKQTIVLTAVQEPPKEKGVAKEVCRPLKPRETWEHHSPMGYWQGRTWRPLIGCPLPELNRSIVLECLRDTHFIALGDSNALRMTNSLQGYTSCTPLQDPKWARLINKGLHVPLAYYCPRHNLRLSWYPQAFPFYTGQGKWSDVIVKRSPRHILDALPARGKYVIAIHLYMHFAQVHPHVYVQHVRDTARGVRDLLSRNSQVKVLIRGPHAMDGYRFTGLGDFYAERCLRVLQHEFRELRDRVVLLDMLDLTKASENCPLHPPLGEVPAQMIISHLCPH